jgi:hypothetical protein
MFRDVTSARGVGGRRLALQFADGSGGIVDINQYIQRGGVYAALASDKLFAKFRVDSETGVLCWPGGIDIAPEELYSRATGTPLPAWMEPVAGETPDYPAPGPAEVLSVREPSRSEPLHRIRRAKPRRRV